MRQPLGCLAWAAYGKDPGFSPGSILEEAARTARYSQEEFQALDFAGQGVSIDLRAVADLVPQPRRLHGFFRHLLFACRTS